MKQNGDYSIGSDKWNGLSKVLEETSELNVVLSKLMGSGGNTDHWSGDLREMMIEEFADTVAAISFFTEKNLSDEEIDRMFERTEMKLNRFRSWDSGKVVSII